MSVSPSEAQGMRKGLAVPFDQPNFRVLFENAPEAMILVGGDGRIMEANRQAERLSGKRRNDVLGHPVNILLPGCCGGEKAGEWPDCCLRLTDVSHRGSDLIVPSGDGTGSGTPVEITAARMDELPGRPMLAIIRDISRQQAAEHALRASEQQLREAQSVAGIGSWDLDLTTNRLAWSVETYRIFDKDPREFRPTFEAFLDLVHQDDRDLVERAFQHSVDRREPYMLDHRISLPDGGIRYVQERGRAFYDNDGKPTRAVGTIQDITERRRADEEIRLLAMYDPVSQLPNRRLLGEYLSDFLGDPQSLKGALIFLEVGGLKVINDTLGYEAGDELLRDAARRIQSCIPETDMAARLSGHEFAAVVGDVGADEHEATSRALDIAQRMLTALSRPFDIDGHQRFISPAAGVALLASGKDPAEALKQADLALNQAKRVGPCTVRLFDPGMEAELHRRVTMETSLRRALELGEIRPYFQGQFDHKGRMTGAEALARWWNPDRGLVGPDEFIPVAEDTGLVAPLGRSMVEQVCSWLARPLARSLPATFMVAVNISVRHFHESDFVEQILEILDRTGAEPCKLQIELTESLLLQNLEETTTKMLALKEAGITLSLDDFGTGYSSLYYLRHLPLDQIKVDQRFVLGSLSNHYDRAIVRAVISLAKSMNLNTIAEGVETEALRDFLHENGCSVYQGYLFSRPLPVDEFERLIRSSV